MPDTTGNQNPTSYVGVRPENASANTVRAQRAPATKDVHHTVGSWWINQTNDEVFVLTRLSGTDSANWQAV